MPSPATRTKSTSDKHAPLTDAVIFGVARLVDDAMTDRREPSHSDIEFQISRFGLAEGDPNQQGQTVGKAKRVRATLSWALAENTNAGERLVAGLIAQVKACGGFRDASPNYVGSEPIASLAAEFRAEGFELTSDGELRPAVLDMLAGEELTSALRAQSLRAQRGASDAALLTGTGKDLLEATAAHVVTERWGRYDKRADFRTLLGQAFVAAGMPTPVSESRPDDTPFSGVDRALYEAACAVNTLRNREGTGHGRPWLPRISDGEARIATQLMGVVAARLLSAYRNESPAI